MIIFLCLRFDRNNTKVPHTTTITSLGHLYVLRAVNYCKWQSSCLCHSPPPCLLSHEAAHALFLLCQKEKACLPFFCLKVSTFLRGAIKAILAYTLVEIKYEHLYNSSNKIYSWPMIGVEDGVMSLFLWKICNEEGLYVRIL